ncbi:MAG: hypothetical protein BWX63_02076 [Bacteroidetes bacterium ADurb.Bin041]|nr:MAG: hypothetical protein BWX63_02076 [Bacteroidetes bacterium ADurb.Bin041]
MDITNKVSSFLSEDIAYFLGLIVGRGTIIKSAELNKLVVDFPFKNLEATSPIDSSKKFDTQIYLSNSLDKIVERIKRLGLDVSKFNDEDNRGVSLVVVWRNTDLTWQFLSYLLNGDFSDYHSFRIPKAIFQADKEKQKEFLRGYFDVTGYVRASNAQFGREDQQRIYLEVDHRNWFLVLDLYKLFEIVGIPIESIDFGHPNFRDPHFKKSAGFWAKEHQVKIFANQFLPVGSYLKHKQEVLTDLAKMNKAGIGDNSSEKKFRIREKAKNPEENSEKLPDFLKEKHFNHYSELLAVLEENDNIKAYE